MGDFKAQRDIRAIPLMCSYFYGDWLMNETTGSVYPSLHLKPRI